MSKETAEFLYKWYYSPGEVIRSIGFYINPYLQWEHSRFQHVFAIDASYNLYVGQFSVYQKHIDEIFELKDKREHGILWTGDTPVIDLHFIEDKNIIYFNRRLKKIAQRLLDYGMPGNSVIVSRQVDLWHMTIDLVLGGNRLKKPSKERLSKLLGI